MDKLEYIGRQSMEKPKAISARDYVDSLPYIGEYFQPDDSVYRKASMDEYIKYLEIKAQSNKPTG